jgi:hypothetical protein
LCLQRDAPGGGVSGDVEIIVRRLLHGGDRQVRVSRRVTVAPFGVVNVVPML